MTSYNEAIEFLKVRGFVKEDSDLILTGNETNNEIGMKIIRVLEMLSGMYIHTKYLATIIENEALEQEITLINEHIDSINSAFFM